MQAIKTQAYALIRVDTSLNDEEIIFYILNGLGSDYKEISATIYARDSSISFEELHDRLYDYKVYLKRESQSCDTTSFTTNFTNKANSNNKGKIHNNPNNHSRSNMQQCHKKRVNKFKQQFNNKITYQIYDIEGHASKNVIACKLLFHGCFTLA